MRIGLDISIQVCRDEGYLVADYTVKEYKENPRHCTFSFSKSYPDYIREEMGWYIGQSMMIFQEVLYDWEMLYELYQNNKEGIDSMIGREWDDIEIPSPYDVLNLANDIDMYCGIG